MKKGRIGCSDEFFSFGVKRRFKVHLCGGEGINWALDHDLVHIQRIAEPFADFVGLEEAEIIHSVWWRKIIYIEHKHICDKAVVASVANDPHNLTNQPDFLKATSRISLWLPEYHQALTELSAWGYPAALFPDPIDIRLFHVIEDRKEAIRKLKERFGIKEESYLIGNFHRDSDGNNLSRPKKQKGADLFFEIVRTLHEMGEPIHVLIAGPRRHWLRDRLHAAKIPFSFVGEIIAGDDREINTLSQETIRDLMRGLDLYLITSRWEGAPNAVHETSAMEVPVISTPVGQSPDLLPKALLFRDLLEGVQLIRRDIKTRHISAWMPATRDLLERRHGDYELGRRLKYIYELALQLPKVKASNKNTLYKKFLPKRKEKLNQIILWGEWDAKQCENWRQAGWVVKSEKKEKGIHLVMQGAEKRFRLPRRLRSSIRVIHRVLSLDQLNKAQIKFNKEFAHATVLISGNALSHFSKILNRCFWISSNVEQGKDDLNNRSNEIEEDLSSFWEANKAKFSFVEDLASEAPSVLMKSIRRGNIVAYRTGWNGVETVGFNSVYVDNFTSSLFKNKLSLLSSKLIERIAQLAWIDSHEENSKRWLRLFEIILENEFLQISSHP